MDNAIQLFSNDEFGTIRATAIDEEPWFVAADVASALEYGAAAKLTRNLFDDEKGVHIVDTPGGNQQVSIISLSGLFHAMNMRRTGVIKNKENRDRVERFQRWVNHEVLPAIVKDGGYMVARDETPEQTMARAVLIAQDTIDRQRRELAELRPKALFADAVAASDGTCLIGELAKMMRQNGVEVGQNRFFEILRNDGFLGKTGSNRNVPTQKSMELGLFRIKETAVTHSDGHVTINRTPKVTGKGQRYFIERYCNTN